MENFPQSLSVHLSIFSLFYYTLLFHIILPHLMASSQQLKTIVISFNFLAAKKVGSTLRGQAFKAMPKVSPMFLAC